MEQEQSHSILADVEVNLVQAGSGKRFANYLIDLVSFYLVFFIAGIIIALVNPETIESIAYEESNTGANLLDRLLTLLFYGIYMFIVEAVFKGRSLGKLITGTKAVNEDGSNISIGTALYRGLARAVPFNAFSALGAPCYPWHDKWSNTYVIDLKQSVTTTEQY